MLENSFLCSSNPLPQKVTVTCTEAGKYAISTYCRHSALFSNVLESKRGHYQNLVSWPHANTSSYRISALISSSPGQSILSANDLLSHRSLNTLRYSSKRTKPLTNHLKTKPTAATLATILANPLSPVITAEEEAEATKEAEVATKEAGATVEVEADTREEAAATEEVGTGEEAAAMEEVRTFFTSLGS